MTDKIKKDTSLGEIAAKYPKAAEVLAKKGMACVGCPMAMMETVEMGAKSHGLDVNKLLKEMNKALKED
jgi:hybrid cluster-associated redox disulfide protein